MDEEFWNSCSDPIVMLDFLKGKERASDRKLRLFALACGQRMGQPFDEQGRQAVQMVEKFADGLATRRELIRARKAISPLSAVGRAVNIAAGVSASVAARAASTTVIDAAAVAGGLAGVEKAFGGPLGALMLGADREFQDGVRHRYRSARRDAEKTEQEAQCSLIRDLFGPLPFRPVSVEESWLRWSDGTVSKIAAAIYEEQRFEELPILADALEDAGCDNDEILSHCRSARLHVKGC